MVAALVALAGAVALAAQIAVAADLRAFEWPVLWQLLGWQGLALLAVLNLTLVLLVLGAVRYVRQRPAPAPRLTLAATGVSLVLLLWVAQWLFVEVPPTIRPRIDESALRAVTLPRRAEQDFAAFSLVRSATTPEARDRLRVMYARAYINNPDAYAAQPIGATVDRHAERLGISPTFLFFRLYLISFYGEATSGPVPFLRNVTAEAVRDLVQIHLPAWFVESHTRTHLITSELLPSLFGEEFGTKLRYAVHKATLDVSAQPYDLSTFSDVYAMLRAYPQHFPDVYADEPADELRRALRDTLAALDGTAVVAPFEQPFETPNYDETYYRKHREHLKTFARAAYYLTLIDLDFATRVQSLLSLHHAGVYERALGTPSWQALPEWQRTIMLNMPRDLFKPNIGRLGYNLYAIPELNCTPVVFVATSALAERSALHGDMTTTWRPSNRDALWAAGGFQLTVLNEVWSQSRGAPIPGINVSDTVPFASQIVGLNEGRLHD
jgi:hypothetical protein